MNNTENKNLTRIVVDVQNGVDGAFEKLYNETIKFSYATASLLLSSKEDIEDVLQNSYMYVAKYIVDLRNPDSFLSWLSVIVKRECKKHIIHSIKSTDIYYAILDNNDREQVDEEELPFDLIEQKEISCSVQALVDKLPEDKKACIVLYYFEQHTLPEISEILGIPEGTVKSRLHSARKMLEKEFNKLQKKDERLLGVAVIPLVTALFASQFKNAAVPAALAEGSALLAAVEASAVTAGSLGAAGGASIGATASAGAASAGAAGTAVATKVVAVAVAAAVTTGGSVATVNYVNEKKNNTSTTYSVTEEYTTEHKILSETVPLVVFSETSTELVLTPVRETKAGTTAVKTTALKTTALKTTEKQTTVHRETTKAVSTTKPTTTNSTTARPTATHPTTTARVTDSAEFYSVSDGILTEYSGSEINVEIPAEIDSKAIGSIGTGAFAGNTDIESVSIPSGVTRIGQEAFVDCRYLEEVELPSTLDSIGIGAFCNCPNLRSVNIPSGTSSIGDDAFADCSRLTSVTIPASVTSIGDNAFGGCDNLKIKCYEGSAAHEYAVENSIDFELI